ncbi:MAG: amino acid-binding protein [Planctomycetota bacterium]|jgi:hypothetical protein
MKVDVSRVDVWAASMEDRPGGLAEKLDALAQAGADLEFVVARRSSASPGTGVVFITPIKGPKQIRAARKAGFEKTKSLHGIRITAGNKPGFGAELTKQLAQAGFSLRGFSGAAIGNRAIIHVALDSEADANKAVRLLK